MFQCLLVWPSYSNMREAEKVATSSEPHFSKICVSHILSVSTLLQRSMTKLMIRKHKKNLFSVGFLKKSNNKLNFSNFTSASIADVRNRRMRSPCLNETLLKGQSRNIVITAGFLVDYHLYFEATSKGPRTEGGLEDKTPPFN